MLLVSSSRVIRNLRRQVCLFSLFGCFFLVFLLFHFVIVFLVFSGFVVGLVCSQQIRMVGSYLWSEGQLSRVRFVGNYANDLQAVQMAIRQGLSKSRRATTPPPLVGSSDGYETRFSQIQERMVGSYLWSEGQLSRVRFVGNYGNDRQVVQMAMRQGLAKSKRATTPPPSVQARGGGSPSPPHNAMTEHCEDDCLDEEIHWITTVWMRRSVGLGRGSGRGRSMTRLEHCLAKQTSIQERPMDETPLPTTFKQDIIPLPLPPPFIESFVTTRSKVQTMG